MILHSMPSLLVVMKSMKSDIKAAGLDGLTGYSRTLTTLPPNFLAKMVNSIIETDIVPDKFGLIKLHYIPILKGNTVTL